MIPAHGLTPVNRGRCPRGAGCPGFDVAQQSKRHPSHPPEPIPYFTGTRRPPHRMRSALSARGIIYTLRRACERSRVVSVQLQRTGSKWRWNNNVPFLREQVLIPWSELHYYHARVPMQSWLRFDIRNTKATFFFRESVALELLRAAGQTASVSFALSPGAPSPYKNITGRRRARESLPSRVAQSSLCHVK